MHIDGNNFKNKGEVEMAENTTGSNATLSERAYTTTKLNYNHCTTNKKSSQGKKEDFFNNVLEERDSGIKNNVVEIKPKPRDRMEYLEYIINTTENPSEKSMAIDFKTVLSINKDNMNNVYNAIRVVYLNSSKIAYCINSETWFIWNGKIWEEDETTTSHKLREVILQTYNVILEFNKGMENEEIKKCKSKMHSDRSIKEVIHLLPTASLSASTMFDYGLPTKLSVFERDKLNNHKVIVFSNGTLYLDTREFKEQFNPYDFCTVMLDFEYNSKASCELWEQSLDSWTDGSHHYKQLLKTLMGRNFLAGENKEQTMTILIGKGGTGKSLFIETLKSVMDNKTLMTGADKLYLDSDKRANYMAKWEGKKHIIFSESESDKDNLSRFNESAFKNMTGDKELEVRKLYSSPYSIKNTFCYTLVTNHDLKLNNWDTSITRRLEIFNWVCEKINKVDKNLDNKLKREKSGIFNWLLEGYYLYIEKGIVDEMDYLNECKQEFIIKGDRIAQFIEDSLVHIPTEKALFKDVYKRYEDFIEENYKFPITKQQLTKELASRGIETAKGTGNAKYVFDYLLTAKEEDINKVR
jgi:putative DNA primase/helicase